MQAIKGMTANSKENSSPLLDIIGALQTILAPCEVTIPHLETPYCGVPNTYQSAMHEDWRISAILNERQQQLDTLCLSDQRHPLASEREGPLQLTGVCRRWREVSLGTSGLWSRLRVSVDCSYHPWEPQASGYDKWLKRSRGHPLSLELLLHQETDATKLRSLLQPYISQISSLSITLYDGGVEQPELLLHDLPALKELDIQGRRVLGYIPAIPQSILRLPSTLRSLKVVDSHFDTIRLNSFAPVMAHLTNLDIATLERPSAVLHLLQLCPNLSSFKVYTIFNERETPELESFTHTRLQTFLIRHRCSFTDPLSGLFDALSLPNLRELEVYRNCGVQCSREHLTAFLERSKCPLESLIFSGWDMPTSRLVHYPLPSLDDILLAEYCAENACDDTWSVFTYRNQIPLGPVSIRTAIIP
ncbi:hypothetical protein EDB19DRAFT_2036274 [Suillus lakei]|nr:hypothetical protein EDB19DRAFT_2036274 [Suillus lakei]